MEPSSINRGTHLARQLNRISLVDLDADVVPWATMACAVFACGTEVRSTAIVARIGSELRNRSLVLEFEEGAEDDVVVCNRRVFSSIVGDDGFFRPAGDVSSIIERIQNYVFRSAADRNTVFMDISSMPRSWYLGILTWFRYSPLAERLRLVVGYAAADYGKSYPDRQIMELRSIPGTGGYYDASQPVLAIVSLGFDAGAALTVEERIEPERVVAILARTPRHERDTMRSELLNEELLARVDQVIYLPHLSFSVPFRGVCELLAPLTDVNIACVGLGPKTHVLALAAAGMIFPRATSLHVVSRYSGLFRGVPTGQFAFAELQLVFEPTAADGT